MQNFNPFIVHCSFFIVHRDTTGRHEKEEEEKVAPAICSTSSFGTNGSYPSVEKINGMDRMNNEQMTNNISTLDIMNIR